MEITPRQLVMACAALFGGIVAINLISQYRDNADVKERLSSLDLTSLVPKLKREEMMEIEPPVVDEDLLINRLNDKDGTPVLGED